MKLSPEIIIFYIILIDSLSANIVAWFGADWYVKHFRIISRYFPVTKGWTTYYLILVLWIGIILYRYGAWSV